MATLINVVPVIIIISMFAPVTVLPVSAVFW
jgi:hypothetical protein